MNSSQSDMPASLSAQACLPGRATAMTFCSVVAGGSSTTVHCGRCAGPIFHSCSFVAGVVRRHGSRFGSSHGGTALIERCGHGGVTPGKLGRQSAASIRAEGYADAMERTRDSLVLFSRRPRIIRPLAGPQSTSRATRLISRA